MFDNAIKFLSEPMLYYKSEINPSWERHEGGYIYSHYQYKEFKRFQIILYRVFKGFAPFICVVLINLVVPVALNNPILWIAEYLLCFVLIAPVGNGIYPLLRKSIHSKLRNIVKYFLGE